MDLPRTGATNLTDDELLLFGPAPMLPDERRFATRRFLIVVLVSWAAAPAASVAGEADLLPASLSIQPEAIVTDYTTPRNLIRVTVRDAKSRTIPWIAVDFESADPSRVMFPHPRAFTDADGVAANFVLRVPEDPDGLETTITVSSGPLRSDPVPVTGDSSIGDGSPFQFVAPPLEAFDGRRQRLRGTVGFFGGPLPIGTTVRAWPIDPRIVDPGPGTITATGFRPFPHQTLEFELFARETGETVIIVATIDLSVYTARVAGELDPILVRGNCDGDGIVGIGDAVFLLEFLFRMGPRPVVRESCNTNDDRSVNVTDAVYLLLHLFAGGPAPPAPFPDPGVDPTP